MPKSTPPEHRFPSKYDVDSESGCWVAKGRSSNGYGAIWVNGRNVGLHVFSWSLVNGSVPQGMEIDHLCRNRACCNPDHLEAVSHAENMRRSPITFCGENVVKTHCPHGHELSADNLDSYALKTGRRACKKCMQRRCREWHGRNREARIYKMREYKASRQRNG